MQVHRHVCVCVRECMRTVCVCMIVDVHVCIHVCVHVRARVRVRVRVRVRALGHVGVCVVDIGRDRQNVQAKNCESARAVQNHEAVHIASRFGRT